MKANYPEFYNKNYKTDKLKDKFKNHFQSKIRFWQGYAGTCDLVYSEIFPDRLLVQLLKTLHKKKGLLLKLLW